MVYVYVQPGGQAFHARGWRAQAWFVARGGSRARARAKDLADGRGHKKAVSAGITPAATLQGRAAKRRVAFLVFNLRACLVLHAVPAKISVTLRPRLAGLLQRLQEPFGAVFCQTG